MSMASILDGVEQALVPIGDHTTSASASIWDRMRFHRARVVSLAVVQDFAVVAAKAYFSDEAAAETIGNSALLQAASISKPLTLG
jgi:hypothetical protein